MRYLKFILEKLFFISLFFLFPYFSWAESETEIEALQRALAELREENVELKKLLEISDSKIENQKKLLVDKESKITAFKDSARKERQAKRQSSGSSLGRDRGPSGALKIGSLTLGGAIRANYIRGDYSNNAADGAIDGPSRDKGTMNLGTVIFNGKYESRDSMAFAEYRFYDNVGSFGGTHFLHTAWFGKQFNDGSSFKAGIVEVPFGIERFGAAYGYLNHLDTIVGLADDRDLGISYNFALSDWDVDIAYFVGSEPEGHGESENSARGSYDIISPYSPVPDLQYNSASFAPPTGTSDYPKNNYLLGNFSPWKEGEQFNIRLKKEFYSGNFDNVIGASYQYGTLESTDDLERFDEGTTKASSIFIKSTYGAWQLKAAYTQYHYDIDTAKLPIASPSFYNPDQIVIGGFDTPFFVSSKGRIPSLGLSYTLFPKVDFIDYLVPYIDYSRIIKDGETNFNYYNVISGTEFNDSEQFSIGTMVGIGSMLIYLDLSYGKGSPLVGNVNSQYFTGASFNGGQTGLSFDESWQHRFTINFGYYY